MGNKKLRGDDNELLADRDGACPATQYQRMSDARDVLQVEVELQNEELRRIQLELEQATDRYFRLFDLAPMPFVGTDASAVIVEINAAASRLLGVDRAAAIGSPFARYVADSDAIGFHQRFREATHGGEGRPIELSLSRRKRALPILSADHVPTVPVRMEIVPLVGAEEETYLLSLVDLSVLNATLASLADEQRRIEAIFDAAVDAIVTVDMSGLVHDFNPAAEKMFGISAREITGQQVQVLLPSQHRTREARDDNDDHSDEVGGASDPRKNAEAGKANECTPDDFAGLVGREREITARRADGSEFPAYISIASLGEAGYCGYIRDLTFVKQAEEELRQAHKMEAVGTLASGIAHDFNNLLMGITGCAEIAAETVDGDSSARMYLEEIIAAAASGTEIARQLLTFGRKGDDGVESVLELNECVANQLGMLRRMVGADLEVQLTLDAEDSRVSADPNQIVQILMNLAINARDASPDGGTLAIETRQVDIAADNGNPGGRFVALTVRDQGSGMPAAVRARAFEPFYTTKGIGGGTGLGLSTVYGIVQQLGGNASISSEPNKGTSVEIVLPLSTAQVNRRFATKEPEAVGGGSETILLVEDDPRVRLVMRNYLERGGYHVLDAADGPAAIECCVKYRRPIHLLMTDMVLPKMNGDAIAAEVSRLRPEAQVVFVSAHDAAWLRAHGRIDDRANVLQKPIVAADLLAAVRAVLDGEASAESGKGAHDGGVGTGEGSALKPLGTVLIVEPTEAARAAVAEILRLEGWTVHLSSGAEEALRMFESHRDEIDILVTETLLSDGNGASLARQFQAQRPDISVVYLRDEGAVNEPDPSGVVLRTPLDLQDLAETLAEVRLTQAAKGALHD